MACVRTPGRGRQRQDAQESRTSTGALPVATPQLRRSSRLTDAALPQMGRDLAQAMPCTMQVRDRDALILGQAPRRGLPIRVLITAGRRPPLRLMTACPVRHAAGPNAAAHDSAGLCTGNAPGDQQCELRTLVSRKRVVLTAGRVSTTM